ncbi:hypothetical protein [Arenibacterium halophilum]|uniref:Uncharacterized protein n=1 Tax=Arenibacterium halophilum TaxID=2583821 RepID=A0ABY2X9P4_9RHOB|nr:hypothetical protein [Arenibacterium halophilum]TMV13095.1 hypothetical protein FGK64_09955 [Arenibacterium halophilum]
MNAAKVQHRVEHLFAESLADTHRQNKACADEWLNTAAHYKIEWEQVLNRRMILKINTLPHPHRVKIDMNTGAACIEAAACILPHSAPDSRHRASGPAACARNRKISGSSVNAFIFSG